MNNPTLPEHREQFQTVADVLARRPWPVQIAVLLLLIDLTLGLFVALGEFVLSVISPLAYVALLGPIESNTA